MELLNIAGPIPFGRKILDFINSKFVVVTSIALLSIGMFFGIYKGQADDTPDVATVYQYFLLYNKNVSSSEDTKGAVAKALAGVVGSGGNKLSFGYADIVNDAKKDDKKSAEKFVTAMATLSKYNYISTKTQGIASTLPDIIRGVVGFILFIFGLIVDISTNITTPIIKAMATLNVMPLLASVFLDNEAGRKLGETLGITHEDLKNFLTLTLTIATLVIVFSIIWILRKGDIDNNATKKLANRFAGLISAPIVLVCCAYLIAEVADLQTPLKQDNLYSKWLSNVKSYAYKRNFSLEQIKSADISGNQKKGYIDTSYNPYIPNSKLDTVSSNIASISNYSGAFENTQLAIAYMSSSTFDGWDYLSYVKSAQSAYEGAVGSVYARLEGVNGAEKFDPKNLYDIEKGYTSTGNRNTNWDSSNEGGDTAIAAARSDYFDGDTPLVSKYTIWQDRYIYGAKRTGDIKKYYHEKPSWEQIYAKLGGGGNFQLSDASMFYVLNTSFSEKGGTFYLDGPAQGLYGTIASFDSQRPVYYEVSMIGTPLFTVPALLSGPIFVMITTLAAILAFLEIGIMDMNIKPLRAWAKAVSLGDIEYTLAAGVYMLGIVLTIMAFTEAPQLIATLLKSMIGLFGNIITGTTSSDSDSMVAGVGMIGSFLIAVTFAWAFFKVPSFRNKLKDMMMIPWQWANSKGQALEDSADGVGVQNLMEQSSNQRARKQEHWNSWNEANEQRASGYVRDSKTGRIRKASGLEQKLSKTFLKGAAVAGKYNPVGPDAEHSGVENTFAKIEQLGKAERIEKALNAISNDEDIENSLKDAGLDIESQTKALSADNLYNADGSMKTNIKGLSEVDKEIRQNFNDEQAAIDQERKDLTAGLSMDDKQELQNQVKSLEDKQDRGIPLTKEEEQQLAQAKKRLANDTLYSTAIKDKEILKQLAKSTPLVLDEQSRQKISKHRAELEQKSGLTPRQLAELENINRQLLNTDNMSKEDVEKLHARKQKLESMSKLSDAEKDSLQKATQMLAKNEILSDQSRQNMTRRLEELNGIPKSNRSESEKIEFSTLRDSLKIDDAKRSISEEREAIRQLENEKQGLDSNKVSDRMKVANIDKQIADKKQKVIQLQGQAMATRNQIEQQLVKQNQSVSQARNDLQAKLQSVAKYNNDLGQRKQQYINDIPKRLQTSDGRPLTQQEQTNGIKNVIKQTKANVQQFKEHSNGQSAQQLIDSIDQMEKVARNIGATNPSQVYGKTVNLDGLKRDAQEIINKMPINDMNKGTSYSVGGADINNDGIMDEQTFNRYGQSIKTNDISSVGASRDPKIYQRNDNNRF